MVSSLKSMSIAISLTMAAVIISSCAGTPPPNNSPNPAPAAKSTASATPATHSTGGDNILALQREGYTLVNKNGEQYFCRNEPKTGSRLSHDTVCMTEKEIEQLREQTRNNLGNVMRDRPPPQGK